MSGHSPRILGPDDFQAAWSAEPAITRSRIAAAVNHGEPMEDAEDAALAAAYACDQKRQRTTAMRMMTVMMTIVVIAVISAPDGVPSWSRLGVLAVIFGAGIVQFRARHRYDDIAAANEAVVHAYWAERRPPPPTRGTIADAVDEWRQRTVGEGE